MQSQIQQKLKAIIVEHGTSIVNDPRRIKAMLKDLFPQNKREVRVLSTVLDEGFAKRLLRDGDKIPTSISIPQYAQILHDDIGTDLTLAKWAVETWAMALSLEIPTPEPTPTPTPKPTPAPSPQPTPAPIPDWMQCLWDWADLYNVPDLRWVDYVNKNGGYWKGLPRDDIKLLQIIEMDLSHELLVSLPSELSHLTQLRELSLSCTPIPKSEISKIRKLLPNCNIVCTDITPTPAPTPQPTATPKPTPAPTPQPRLTPTPPPKSSNTIPLLVIGGTVAALVGWMMVQNNSTEMSTKNSYQATTAMVQTDFEKLLKIADQGDAEAQNSVGDMYFLSNKYNEAFKYYINASNQGYNEAYYNLGLMYERGLYVLVDENKASDYYKKAIDKGHYKSIAALKRLTDAHKVKTDKQGNETAKKNLAGMQMQSIQIIKKTDFDQQLELANQGNATAQFNMGSMVENGRGITASKTSAIYWYQKAAEQGHEGAKDALKRLNSYSYTQKTEFERTLEQAQKNDILSQITLAWMYENGKNGVLIDRQKAIHWYKQAAYQGNFNAKQALERLGVKNVDKEYLLAKEGNADAQYRLGLIYEHDQQDVASSKDIAIYWYQKAAEQDHQGAQKALKRFSAQ